MQPQIASCPCQKEENLTEIPALFSPKVWGVYDVSLYLRISGRQLHFHTSFRFPIHSHPVDCGLEDR
jgi:hypothetical protein